MVRSTYVCSRCGVGREYSRGREVYDNNSQGGTLVCVDRSCQPVRQCGRARDIFIGWLNEA